MRFVLIFYILFMMLSFNSCVTINVYFPAAAAEKAADQIIDQVWGIPPAPQSKKPEDKDSKLMITPIEVKQLTNVIITPSLAEANLDISSPAIQTIRKRMAQRHPQLLPHYESGAIGLTNDALIALRALNLVPLKSRPDVQTWVIDENGDRLALYREIAVANNHPEWEAKIRATFAARWIERAPVGWWYQNAKGEWQRKS